MTLNKISLDITTEQRRFVLGRLRQHLPGVLVWAYGSRVKGTARHNSDLDLAAFATPKQVEHVARLREVLEESNLPFRVDLLVWDELPENFHQTIKSHHTVLQRAENLAEKKGRGVNKLGQDHNRKRGFF